MISNDKKSQKLNLKEKYYIVKYRNITDSNNIFQELFTFNELIELDISENKLTKLPKDISKLSKLQSLDLTNNPFQNVLYINIV
jgi:Leucine-rich repeat (LRR) protein